MWLDLEEDLAIEFAGLTVYARHGDNIHLSVRRPSGKQELRKRMGLCTKCGVRTPRAGLVTCDRCIARRIEAWCESYRKMKSAKQKRHPLIAREREARILALGQVTFTSCSRCRKGQAFEPFLMCERCRQNRRLQAKAHRNAARKESQ